MNENEETPASSEAQTDTGNDPRFEVKWRKKQTSAPATTPVEGTTTADSPASGGDIEALTKELEEARARVQELQDKWHRSAAEVATTSSWPHAT